MSVGTYNVLLVINSLGGGGAERSLVELLPRYREAGIEPTVAFLKRRDGELESEVFRTGITTAHLGGGNMWTWTRRIRKLLHARTFDLIHTSLFEADLAGRFSAWGTRTPVLTSLVNTSYASVRLSDPNVSRLGLRTVRAIDGWTARHLTSHFHAVSQAVKDASVEALGIDPARITVVERGRSISRLGHASVDRRNAARGLLGLDQHEEVIVNVGRQEFQKGQKTLLQAMARLITRYPRSRLLIAGDKGNATAELVSEHRRLGLGDRVQYLGYRPDVPTILAAADVFVFPSLFEGASGAMIEAMAMGLPIVASDIPSNREVGGECVLLVKAGSVESLAHGLGSLLANQTRARDLGRRAAQEFQNRFTLERSALKMVNLYRNLIGTTSPRS
jgi:glycosyltransferase involved in cell wall biosynthesis